MGINCDMRSKWQVMKKDSRKSFGKKSLCISKNRACWLRLLRHRCWQTMMFVFEHELLLWSRSWMLISNVKTHTTTPLTNNQETKKHWGGIKDLFHSLGKCAVGHTTVELTRSLSLDKLLTSHVQSMWNVGLHRPAQSNVAPLFSAAAPSFRWLFRASSCFPLCPLPSGFNAHTHC